MKYFIYWTADWKSSKLGSAQLWTQFKQLRIEAWKSQDFNGFWTRWTRWLSTLKALAINANRWKCWRKALEKNLHEALGENYKPLRLFAHPLEVLRKALKVLENPLATCWLAFDFYPLYTKPLVYVFAFYFLFWRKDKASWTIFSSLCQKKNQKMGYYWFYKFGFST